MSPTRLTFEGTSSAPPVAPLRSLFLALTQAALASTLGAGCESEADIHDGADAGTDRDDSGAIDPDTEDAGLALPGEAGPDSGLEPGLEPGFTSITCTNESRPDLPGALKTTRPIESLSAVRTFFPDEVVPDAGPNGPSWTVELVHQAEPCSGLADPAPCEERFAELKSSPQCEVGPCAPFAIVREASMLSRLSVPADLLTLIGEVDAPADAVLLAVLDGRTLCAQFSRGMEQGASIRALSPGYEIHSAYESCGEGKYRDKLVIDASGKVTTVEHVKYATSDCTIGRRPDGLVAATGDRRVSWRAAYLAEAARLEAASVFAFEKLSRELTALGAPGALIVAANDALRDEVRHARDVTALARAEGAEPEPPVVRDTALRSLLALALDNISEGCVRETFGALLATYQARAARDGAVRGVMRTIAEDETRHAALSWKLQVWLESQLCQSELEQVRSAHIEALSQLEAEVALGLPAADRRALGLPDPVVATALLAELTRALPAPISC